MCITYAMNRFKKKMCNNVCTVFIRQKALALVEIQVIEWVLLDTPCRLIGKGLCTLLGYTKHAKYLPSPTSHFFPVFFEKLGCISVDTRG